MGQQSCRCYSVVDVTQERAAVCWTSRCLKVLGAMIASMSRFSLFQSGSKRRATVESRGSRQEGCASPRGFSRLRSYKAASQAVRCRELPPDVDICFWSPCRGVSVALRRAGTATRSRHQVERALAARGESRFGAVAIECSHGYGQDGS